MGRKLTTEQFIEKSVKIHGYKYDYSKVIYTFSRDKIIIICPEHGEFIQTANNHLNGKGCSKCYNKFNNSQEFVDYSNKVHNNFYNYEKVIFINTISKVKIVCPEHGEFEQTPYNHIIGKGCGKCGNLKTSLGLLKTSEWFIKKCNKIHNGIYNYSKSDYKGVYDKIKIDCKKHGTFLQRANEHLRGKGCSKCANNYRWNTNDFIKECLNRKGNLYSYEKVIYKNSLTKINILCKKHGYFSQTPTAHLGGQGCPKCVSIISKPELEVFKFIKNLNYEIITSDRSIIKPKELDIYIPSLQKAIEFNGMYWHYDHTNPNCKPKGYHAMKSNLCKEQGIKLLHIREDLWLRDKNQMQEIILKFLEK